MLQGIAVHVRDHIMRRPVSMFVSRGILSLRHWRCDGDINHPIANLGRNENIDNSDYLGVRIGITGIYVFIKNSQNKYVVAVV